MKSLMRAITRTRQSMQQTRAVNLNRPGRRGWRRRGAGRATLIEPAPEFRGTTVQVCGLWPFAAGSGTPVVGVPLGRHLLTASTVCADPVSWFLANLILNPSAFVLGRPGLGKSTLVRRLVTVMSAWGMVPIILSDLKPDYVELVKALGGTVISVGRGLSTVNPLDPGPLGAILDDEFPEDLRRKILAEIRGMQINTLIGLIELVRGAGVEDFEQTLLATALRVLDEQGNRTPLIPDVLELVVQRHPQLAAVAQDRDEEHRYRDRTERLVSALIALGPDGPFGSVFSQPTRVLRDETGQAAETPTGEAARTPPIPLDRPVVFDLSALDDADLGLQAAMQLVCWTYGSSLVNTAKYLAQAGRAPERVYVLVMDELWRMIRASEQMVYRVDALSRLNRQRLTAQIMITHTMNDLKLSRPELTTIAWGFVERSAMVYLGGLAQAEMGNLTEVFAMTRKEREIISDWSIEAGFDAESGTAAAPPGQGNFLLKIGKKPGIPFHVSLTSIERDVNDTNKRWSEVGGRIRSRITEAA